MSAAPKTSARRERVRLVVAAAVGLVVGAIAYLRYRGPIAAEGWLGALGVPQMSRVVRDLIRPLPAIPRWLADVLPDACFAFALACALAAIWVRPARARARAILAGCALACAYELAQAFGLAPGTFDAADVAASTVGAGLAWLVARMPGRR